MFEDYIVNIYRTLRYIRESLTYIPDTLLYEPRGTRGCLFKRGNLSFYSNSFIMIRDCIAHSLVTHSINTIRKVRKHSKQAPGVPECPLGHQNARQTNQREKKEKQNSKSQSIPIPFYY
jgi:hypothetical protein